jgi:hypothetical protein
LGTRTDDLFKEILENVRNDRATVQKVRDQIVKLASDPTIQAEQLAMVGIAENVAKLSDVLTKMNSQLVELTKVSARAERPNEDPKGEKESIFDEIESSGTIDVGEGVN